jgi:hypothetical protein
MNKNCEKIQKEYADLNALAWSFKNFYLRKEKTTALETKKKLEKVFSELSEFSWNNVYHRKKLADKLNYKYIGMFDANGFAVALERPYGATFINRKGVKVVNELLNVETPFKNGYAILTGKFSQSGTYVIDEKFVVLSGYTTTLVKTFMKLVRSAEIYHQGIAVVEWSRQEILGNLIEIIDEDGIRHLVEKDKNGKIVFDIVESNK